MQDLYKSLNKFYNKGFTRSIFNYKYNINEDIFDLFFYKKNEYTIKKNPEIIEIIKIKNYYSTGYINPNNIEIKLNKKETNKILLIDDRDDENDYIEHKLIYYLLCGKNYLCNYLKKKNNKYKQITRESKLGINRETEYVIIQNIRLNKNVKVTDIKNNNIIESKKTYEKKDIVLKVYVKKNQYRYLAHTIFSNNLIIIKTKKCIINIFKNKIYIVLKKNENETLEDIFNNIKYIENILLNINNDITLDFVISSIVLKIDLDVFSENILKHNKFINIYNFINIYRNSIFIYDLDTLEKIKDKYNILTSLSFNKIRFEDLY